MKKAAARAAAAAALAAGGSDVAGARAPLVECIQGDICSERALQPGARARAAVPWPRSGARWVAASWARPA